MPYSHTVAMSSFHATSSPDPGCKRGEDALPVAATPTHRSCGRPGVSAPPLGMGLGMSPCSVGSRAVMVAILPKTNPLSTTPHLKTLVALTSCPRPRTLAIIYGEPESRLIRSWRRRTLTDALPILLADHFSGTPAPHPALETLKIDTTCWAIDLDPTLAYLFFSGSWNSPLYVACTRRGDSLSVVVLSVETAEVAPGKDGAYPTIPPYATGENVNARHLSAGSTLFLPVEVESAVFSIGVSFHSILHYSRVSRDEWTE
ncbi:uncharacterized protein BXZ73DRAFT_99171 [Epithele typhae]|uniref:uncharacterized protein n=1 Tax=Epithele typhae TaxID=378194 RepID=UPI0020079A0D|nr:uncharacterized protein BXZ73DRAFT_99171 [Epithele typhae]KAH9940173.1 hypothetical protein BXZ73DRAFT_99171 [Epithele typhae]